MSYTSREGGQLTAEERDVAAALCGYTTTGATYVDWTPTAALWRAYCDWWARNRWRYDPNAPPRLRVRQFGRAVRRLFPGMQRRKRSFHGRQQWGYAPLCGSESVLTPSAQGGKKYPSPAPLTVDRT